MENPPITRMRIPEKTSAVAKNVAIELKGWIVVVFAVAT